MAEVVEECSICRESYREGDDRKTLQCSHVFHASCIEQWLLMRGNCPNCRAQVADDTLHESEEENDIERTAEVEEEVVIVNGSRIPRYRGNLRYEPSLHRYITPEEGVTMYICGKLCWAIFFAIMASLLSLVLGFFLTENMSLTYSRFTPSVAEPMNCSNNFFVNCSLLQPEMCEYDCISNELCPGFCNCQRTCYHCEAVDRPEDCHNTTTCGSNQVCIVTQTFTQSLVEKFKLGCVDKQICMDLYGSVQSKRSISFDGGCCDENFCNQHDPDVSTPNPITEKVTTPLPSPLDLCQDIDADFCSFSGRKECYVPCFEKMCPVTCGKCVPPGSLACRSCPNDVDDIGDCNSTKICKDSEVCIAIETRDVHAQRKIKLDCVSKSTCDRYNFTVRETAETPTISNVDGYCCNSSDCNSVQLITPAPTTTTVTSNPEPNPHCHNSFHGCPHHFHKIPDMPNSCYQFSTSTSTHDQSLRFCHNSCTRPVIISTIKEAQAITKHMLQNQLSGSYWTDGVKHGRNWTWKSTQQEIMTSLINPDLISYNHTQECLQFGRETQHGVSPDRHFYLDNKPCAERFFTICEYSLA
ncbi:uncharacterized protein LOC125669920 isoform X2 [Ostrea edulis]|uniref:uncharacterized protein LOC125669920 isoform X2 n=1 Tax=Ostrea edulis TaxID=37623 RepID=UPI0024AF8578|nr:uncharacterized protein LOC125669920 isoform X2 [Ostrea edulis]